MFVGKWGNFLVCHKASHKTRTHVHARNQTDCLARTLGETAFSVQEVQHTRISYVNLNNAFANVASHAFALCIFQANAAANSANSRWARDLFRTLQWLFASGRAPIKVMKQWFGSLVKALIPITDWGGGERWCGILSCSFYEQKCTDFYVLSLDPDLQGVIKFWLVVRTGLDRGL